MKVEFKQQQVSKRMGNIILSLFILICSCQSENKQKVSTYVDVKKVCNTTYMEYYCYDLFLAGERDSIRMYYEKYKDSLQGIVGIYYLSERDKYSYNDILKEFDSKLLTETTTYDMKYSDNILDQYHPFLVYALYVYDYRQYTRVTDASYRFWFDCYSSFNTCFDSPRNRNLCL